MSIVLITTFVFHSSLIYCNKHLQNKNVWDKCTTCEHNTQLFVSDLYFSNKLTELQISAQLLAKKPDCQIYEPCYLKHEVKTSSTPA